jgi:gliding motility-associated-like protein
MKQQVKFWCVFLLLHFSFFSRSSAQLCQGSLGDPVVNLTFGSGANPGAPLYGLTNYTYISSDCPPDGSYTVSNSTSNCFNFTWHNVPEDHTRGDVNGYMMVVNASFNRGVFFVTTVDGLCPNTTYEFASWILNVTKPSACNGNTIKPNLTFDIETSSGVLLASYQTGDVPALEFPQWKQYGFYFSTTAGTTSVLLRITNNAPGGCGNDLLLDDITYRACGPLVTAHINGFPDTVDVCTGDNSVFTMEANISGGYNDPVYQWQSSIDNGISWNNIAGASGTTYVRPPVTTTATYLYRFAVSERSNLNISSCSIVSNVISVGVNDFPVTTASNRGSCTGDTISFTADGGALYSWMGPLGFTSNDQSPFITNATVANNGVYYVNVTSAKGCATLDSTDVKISIRPDVNAGADTGVCEGSGIQLQSSGNNILAYQWSPATSVSNSTIPNPVAFPKDTTIYILTASNERCNVSDSVQISVYFKPVADAGPDKVIIEGQSINLNGAVSGTEITYSWNPPDFMSDGGTLSPSVMPPNNKEYILQVLSGKGCGIATDKVMVKVFKQLYIPNAFTPNHDGLNDTWFIETLKAYPNASVKVYNRYGQMVFDNKGTNNSWDGTFKGVLQSIGAYAYIIDLKNNTKLIKGVVYIIL